MVDEKKSQDGFVIEGELTIYTVMEWKDKFIAGLLTNDVMEVDLSNVNEFDGAGLQLLIVAKQGAKALNKDLRIIKQSPVVTDLFNLSSLSGFFGE